jgi:hypothetical protein
MILTGNAELFEKKKSSKCHFRHHKSHIALHGFEHGLLVDGPVTNHLSHGIADRTKFNLHYI